MNDVHAFLGVVPAVAAPANMVFLPSGEVDNRASAEMLAPKLANSNIYSLNGAVVEAVRGANGEIELAPLRAEGAATRFQKYASFFALRRPDDKWVHSPQPKPPLDTMKELLAGGVLAAGLRPISEVSPCPLIVENAAGQIEVLGSGYHEAHRVLIDDNAPLVPDVPLGEAIAALLEVTGEYGFASPGDHARMIADYITPALVMGDLLGSQAPISITEANESQAGKGFHQKIVRAFYRAKTSHVAQHKGGVGSFDESFATAAVRGQSFISIDNVRDRIDSPLLESALTAESDTIQARVPYVRAVPVSLRRRVIQVTSNGLKTTPDTANRANIVRILKLRGHVFHRYPEGDLEAHVKAKQPYYLGCVFSLVKAWHTAGKPCNDGIGHDRRRWAGVMDWILKLPGFTLLGVGGLMDGHEEAKMRMSNPEQSWLRNVCVALEGEPLALAIDHTASSLSAFCSSHDIAIPGKWDSDLDDGARAIGGIMRRLFAKADGNVLLVEGFVVTRTQTEERGPDRHRRPVNFYRITSTPVAEPTVNSTEWP